MSNYYDRDGGGIIIGMKNRPRYDGITYQLVGINTDVFLNGRRVGTIRPVSNGFAYYPIGSRTSGEVLSSMEAVKATLEEM